LSFNDSLDKLRPRIKNKPHAFGNQTIVHPDGTTETEPFLLFPAASISVMELPRLVREHGGLFWPAHVDRGTNSLLNVLGSWPKELNADAVEVSNQADEPSPCLIPDSIKKISASDAHRFSSMVEDGFPLPLGSADFEGLSRYLRE